MDRRSFLKGSAIAVAAPLAVVEVAILKSNGLRISAEKDDPGYRAYCLANGDGKRCSIYLNGELQKLAVTGDEAAGMVKRVVVTPSGNFAHANGEILHEEVFGDVKIVIE